MPNIPWLLIAVIAYNILAFALATPAGGPGVFEQEIATIPLMSGAVCPLRLGDAVIALALVLLLAELAAAPPPSGHSIVDHGFSIAVFLVCVLEFLIVPRAGTPVFLTITVIALLDAAAGAVMALKSAASVKKRAETRS
jgi:hypothetical protein